MIVRNLIFECLDLRTQEKNFQVFNESHWIPACAGMTFEF